MTRAHVPYPYKTIVATWLSTSDQGVAADKEQNFKSKYRSNSLNELVVT
jgi:hypothetical protein